MQKKYFLTIVLSLLLAGACSRTHLKPIVVKRNFAGAIWVVRHEIATKSRINKLLDTIEDTDIKNIFVQIRGRGDAYYDSGIEPPGFDVPENFDPLAYLIERTRRSDIKIHAWVNMSFILNAGDYPPVKQHIFYSHPEWATYDIKGRPITDYSEKELRKNLLEGYFLDPALPQVKKYLNSIIVDILTRYRVDGLHYDFIRYPYSGYSPYYKKNLSDFGYNPLVMKNFIKRYGFDPRKKCSDTQKKIFNQFREDQITRIVEENTQSAKLINPDIIISAAVMPRYDWGIRVYFQNWPLWLKRGYIDIACIMSYTGKNKVFDNYLEYARRTKMQNKIFMGIRVKKNTPIRVTLDQIKKTYVNGMRGYILFSFNHDEDYLERLDNLINYERYIFQLNL